MKVTVIPIVVDALGTILKAWKEAYKRPVEICFSLDSHEKTQIPVKKHQLTLI